MATVTEHIINGAESEINSGGRTDVRSFLIEGLVNGTSSGTAAGIWDEVYGALIGVGVSFSAVHPYNGLLFCSRIKPIPFANNSKTAARALAYYSSAVASGQRIVRFRAWTERILTSRFTDKSLIITNYTGPDGTVFPPQLSRVPGTRAIGKLIIEEDVFFDPEPLLVCINKLNQGTYRGQEEHTFLCTAVNYDPTGDGRWHVVFEADYKEDGWKEAAFYTNPVTGQPYPDVIGSPGTTGSYDPDTDVGNGYTNNQVQDDINFASFGF